MNKNQISETPVTTVPNGVSVYATETNGDARSATSVDADPMNFRIPFTDAVDTFAYGR